MGAKDEGNLDKSQKVPTCCTKSKFCPSANSPQRSFHEAFQSSLTFSIPPHPRSTGAVSPLFHDAGWGANKAQLPTSVGLGPFSQHKASRSGATENKRKNAVGSKERKSLSMDPWEVRACVEGSVSGSCLSLACGCHDDQPNNSLTKVDPHSWTIADFSCGCGRFHAGAPQGWGRPNFGTVQLHGTVSAKGLRRPSRAWGGN